jgi:hypothetical protein
MGQKFDIFAEYKLAHSRFASLTERLAFLRRINKSDTDPDLSLDLDAHVDRGAVDNRYCASADRLLLQVTGD